MFGYCKRVPARWRCESYLNSQGLCVLLLPVPGTLRTLPVSYAAFDHTSLILCQMG